MPSVETASFTGPVSYTTGGETVATGLSTVDWAHVEVSVPGANLPLGHIEITRNSPAAGQFKWKFVRYQYDETSSIDSPSGLPAGVTAPTTSGQTYDNESAHNHTINHNHAPVTSGTNNNAGGGTTVDLTAPQAIGAHTHSFDPLNFTGESGPGSAHTHTWNNIYQHQHSLGTQTETNTTLSELSAGTNLSGATLIYKAVKL